MEAQPRSRRERPAKPALSRAGIVAATVAIMEREGLDKATMRRVAQALDTGPASLYVYVANTAELHAAVLDELLGSIAPAAAGRWQVRLEETLRAYGAVLFAHPGLARAALLLGSTGPNWVRLVDRVLGLLLEGGVEPTRAAWGVDLLLQQVTAGAAEHAEPSSSDIDAPSDAAADWDRLTSAVRHADPATTPHVAAHADALIGGTPTQRMSWVLAALVAGITATPTPSPHDPQPGA